MQYIGVNAEKKSRTKKSTSVFSDKHLKSQLLTRLAQYSENTYKLQEQTTTRTSTRKFDKHDFIDKITHMMNALHTNQVGY